MKKYLTRYRSDSERRAREILAFQTRTYVDLEKSSLTYESKSNHEIIDYMHFCLLQPIMVVLMNIVKGQKNTVSADEHGRADKVSIDKATHEILITDNAHIARTTKYLELGSTKLVSSKETWNSQCDENKDCIRPNPKTGW